MGAASAFAVFLFATAVIVAQSTASSSPRNFTCSPRPPPQLPGRYAGQIIYCTPEDKICLDRNKVFFEGKCYTLGSPGPCREGEIFVVNKKVYDESKFVRGACAPIFPCDRNQFQERMSYDQCCYETSDINTHICPPEMNWRLRKNVFGEGECELISNTTNTYTAPKFPLREGFCYFPNDALDYKYILSTYADLFPGLQVQHALTNMTLRCSARERECFEADRVLARDGRCHPLLTRGPCAQDQWLVLDAGALEAERAVSAVCAGPRCPPAHLFMAREQRCRALRQLQTELCAAEDLLLDVFGEAHCGRFVPQAHLLRMPRPLDAQGDVCALQPPGKDLSVWAAQSVLLPLCGPDDQERCRLPVLTSPDRLAV